MGDGKGSKYTILNILIYLFTPLGDGIAPCSTAARCALHGHHSIVSSFLARGMRLHTHIRMLLYEDCCLCSQHISGNAAHSVFILDSV